MGLDIYAYAAEIAPDMSVDFPASIEADTEIHYWRNHTRLHRWMEHRYRRKGGVCLGDGLSSLVLNEEDLMDLDPVVRAGRLPWTWSGLLDPIADWRRLDDHRFILQAKEAIRNGQTVYVTSGR